MSGSHFDSIAAVYDKVPYDSIRDFRPLGAVCEVPLVMIASLSVAASTAAELVALAKSRPDAVFAASSGNGAFSHLNVPGRSKRDRPVFVMLSDSHYSSVVPEPCCSTPTALTQPCIRWLLLVT